MEMADLRNEVEAQNYLIEKLINESLKEEKVLLKSIDLKETLGYFFSNHFICLVAPVMFIFVLYYW